MGPHDFPVLWLMRHGETEWSRDHRYTGLTDLELTPAGVQQARDAAAKLAGVRFRTVLTSPLARARQTAELAGYPEAEVVPEAHEWDYGDYEGLQSAAIRAKDPSYLIWTHGVRGGESLQQVADRADHVIAKVLDGGDGAVFSGLTSGGTSGGASGGASAGRRPAPGATWSDTSEPRQVLLVAHGHFLRVLAARWLGMEPVEGRHFVLETAAVCRLGWDKKTPAIAGWNL
jgi:broad specificity phosphatase PhoE